MSPSQKVRTYANRVRSRYVNPGPALYLEVVADLLDAGRRGEALELVILVAKRHFKIAWVAATLICPTSEELVPVVGGEALVLDVVADAG